VEILLTIRACREDALLEWAHETLGKPKEVISNKSFWHQKQAVIVAQVPVEPRVCEINLLAPTETRVIEWLRTGKVPEEPKTEEPKTEEPTTDEPTTDEPTTDEPTTDKPKTE
jgi:hypothetical protein